MFISNFTLCVCMSIQSLSLSFLSTCVSVFNTAYMYEQRAFGMWKWTGYQFALQQLFCF